MTMDEYLKLLPPVVHRLALSQITGTESPGQTEELQVEL
jgi:hypothetical protein